MIYEIAYSTKFKKDYKLMVKRHYDMVLLEKVITILASGQELPKEYKDHSLAGNYASHRECHITSDWLLVYRIEEGLLVLVLIRTGTHSDLF